MLGKKISSTSCGMDDTPTKSFSGLKGVTGEDGQPRKTGERGYYSINLRKKKIELAILAEGASRGGREPKMKAGMLTDHLNHVH